MSSRRNLLASLLLAGAAVAAHAEQPLDDGFWCGNGLLCGAPGRSVIAPNRGGENRDQHVKTLMQRDGTAFVIGMSQVASGDRKISLTRLLPDGRLDAAYGKHYFGIVQGIDDAIEVTAFDDALVLYSVSSTEKRLVRIDLMTHTLEADFNDDTGFFGITSMQSMGVGKIGFMSAGPLVVGYGRLSEEAGKYELCMRGFNLSGTPNGGTCLVPESAEQADILPDVVAAVRLATGSSMFVARMPSASDTSPGAYIFGPGGNAVLSTAIRTPLYLNGSCGSGESLVTTIDDAAASPAPNQFVLVGARVDTSTQPLGFYEYAAVFTREGTTISRIGSTCQPGAGESRLLAVAPGRQERGGARFDVPVAVSYARNTQQLRVLGVFVSDEGVALNPFTDPIDFPSSTAGAVAPLSGDVGIVQQDGRVTISATKATTATDQDLAFARYLFVDPLFRDSFEE